MDHTKLPIIIFSIFRQDGFSSSPLSLAKALSKHNQVFYIDNPLTIKDFVKLYNEPVIQSRKEALLFGKNLYSHIDPSLPNLIDVKTRLTFSINWMPQGKLYDFFLRLNNKILISTLRKIKKQYKLKDFILLNSFNPFFGFDLPADLRPTLSVYQSVDDISESLYVRKHGVELENRAMSNADLVLATSLGLRRKLSKNVSKEIHYLPNAADISIFKQALQNSFERPPELNGIDKKIIGYTGNICQRIDYALLTAVAKRHSDKIILMIGPRNDKKFSEFDLEAFPNIIFAGPKPITELPRYLHYMDCTIIPFKCNELTKSIYPLKVNEYLAAGKAVVSTNFSEDIAEFKNIVYLAASHEEFINNIDKAIEEKMSKVDERVKTAEGNTWEGRVNLFWNIVERENLHK